MQFQPHEYYNCEALLSNGRRYRIEGNWLHNENLDHWEGWNCEAGYNRIYIDADDNVYGGQCLNDQLGHLRTGWDVLPTATVCKKARCNGCTDDLIISKSENTQ